MNRAVRVTAPARQSGEEEARNLNSVGRPDTTLNDAEPSLLVNIPDGRDNGVRSEFDWRHGAALAPAACVWHL